MLIGELINNLAQKAGIAQDDAKLKSLLASPELASVQVDDDLAKLVDGSLLSIEAAKNNHPIVRDKYLSEFRDGVDKKLLSLIETDTFSEDDIRDIMAETKTNKRLEIVISKLKEAKGKASGADKDAINAQLNAAHEAARLAKAEVETVKSSYEGKIKDIQLKAAIKAVFGNYKTIYDELPPAVRSATMEAIIMQGLQDKNAELRTDEHGNLQLVSKDGSSNIFGENHVQLTPESFLDKTFAPILKVSGPPKPAATPPRQQNAAPAPGEVFTGATTDFVKSHVDKVIADMAATPANMM